jgi:hypothetical protein
MERSYNMTEQDNFFIVFIMLVFPLLFIICIVNIVYQEENTICYLEGRYMNTQGTYTMRNGCIFVDKYGNLMPREVYLKLREQSK